MKHKCKRLSALLLTVCLLLSMAVPAVWADEASADTAQTVTYDFRYIQLAELPLDKKTYSSFSDANKQKLEDAYGTKINSIPLYYDATNFNAANNKNAAPNITEEGIHFTVNGGDWLALKMQSPGEGAYALTLTIPRSTKGATACNVYILPGNTTAEAIANGSALTADALIKEDLDILNSSSEAVLSVLGKYTFTADVDYIILFKSTVDTTTRSDIKLTSLTLDTDGGMTVDGPESGEFTHVKAEVAAKNAITNATITNVETWLNPQNGHTYLYLINKGGLLVVYDMNTKEIIDTEENVTSHGRGTYVDADGILWFIGSTRYLYRYDPYTLTCTRLQWDANIAPDITSFAGFGVTGDEEGNIYFGTYNVPYLIKYDPDANTFENLTGGRPIDPDVTYCGFGGLVVDGGFIYADIRGMANAAGEPVKTHKIIKFDLAKRKIVGSVDIYPCFGNDVDYLKYLTMVDGVLIGSTTSKLARTITVDAETMELIDIEGMENGVYGYVSEPVDNKVYYFGYLDNNPTATDRCLYEYDITTRKATQRLEIPWGSTLTTNNVVTIQGSDQVPGPALVGYKASAEIEVVLYSLDPPMTIQYSSMIYGAGNRLREVITDPSGENIWVGAYGVSTLAQYNIASGKVIKQMKSYDHQTDSLMWYDGNFYSTNYGACCITRLNIETGVNTPLYRLESTAFNQERTFALTAGDGKLFGGTVPSKGRNGGVLVWYDLEKELTYVAGGPNPEDVYYTQAYDWDAATLLESYTWYNAATNQVVDFDDNDDGIEDYNIIVDGVEMQRFYGTIDKQTIKEIVYQNGYIYGITTLAGGSTATDPEDTNAVIFVYDVEAMKVIQTIDLSEFIEGLPTPVKHIDSLAADPDVEGKFWGVVCDTLFSFTYDATTGAFNIQEELSLGKGKYPGGSTWQGRDIVFDGDYMYVAFAGSANVTTMINKTNSSEYYVIYKETPDEMTLGADDNLYFINFDSVDLMVLNIADQTAPIKDPSEAARVQALINALDDATNITLEDEAAVLAARAAYDKLTEAGKALVTDISKLTAAEAALEALTNPTTDPSAPTTPDSAPAPSASPVVIVVLIVVAVAVLAAIAVFVIIKRKRK